MSKQEGEPNAYVYYDREEQKLVVDLMETKIQGPFFSPINKGIIITKGHFICDAVAEKAKTVKE